MLFVFNAGVLALAGFLLVWHTVAGTLDTAREGRFGFGAWEIVRIIAAIALMAPLPGGMNGAQHAVIGLAHLGGDFANAVWKPFSEEALAAGKSIAPRPREAVWRAAIARALILETCRFAANESAARAGDAPYIELREERLDRKSPGTTRVRRIEGSILHYDGAGRGMPGDLCGAIRFAGLGAEGAPGLAAAGHRNALAALLPDLRVIAADLAAHYVTGSPVYGRPLPDLDRLLERNGLAGRYAGVLDTALVQAASEEQAALARVVAEDAKKASWMSAASFFNTIAHRTGLFQAAVHNIPAVGLPPPSLGKWAPAADAAVKGLTTALIQSRGYQPLLFTAAAGGAAALPAPGGDGGMAAGLLEFIDLDSVIVTDSGNPIADLAALGHGLMNAALAAMTALMGAAAGSGLLESVPFIGKGLDMFESVWQVSDGLVSHGARHPTDRRRGACLPAAGAALHPFPVRHPRLGHKCRRGGARRHRVRRRSCDARRRQSARHPGDAPGLAVPARPCSAPAVDAVRINRRVPRIPGGDSACSTRSGFPKCATPALRAASAPSASSPCSPSNVMIAYGLMNAAFKLIDILPSAVLDWIGGRGGGGDEGGDRVGGAVTGAFSRIGGLRIGAGTRRGGGIPGSR